MSKTIMIRLRGDDDTIDELTEELKEVIDEDEPVRLALHTGGSTYVAHIVRVTDLVET